MDETALLIWKGTTKNRLDILKAGFLKIEWDSEHIQQFLMGLVEKGSDIYIKNLFQIDQGKYLWEFYSMLLYELQDVGSLHGNPQVLLEVLMQQTNVLASFSMKDHCIPGTIDTSSVVNFINESGTCEMFMHRFRLNDPFSERERLGIVRAFFCQTHPFEYMQKSRVLEIAQTCLFNIDNIAEATAFEELISNSKTIWSLVEGLMSQHPSVFMGSLVSDESRNSISERDLVRHLVSQLPSFNFCTKGAFYFSRHFFAALVRLKLGQMNRSLIGLEANDIYRKFPLLVALFTAFEDVEMIEFLARSYNLPIGPLKWIESDKSCEFVKLSKIYFRQSPIATAVEYENDQLINIFSEYSKVKKGFKKSLKKALARAPLVV